MTTEEIVIARPDDVPEEPTDELVIDNLYRFVSLYQDTEADKRDTIKRRLGQMSTDDGTVICTTSPYQLWWVLKHARDDLEDLFGGIETYRVRLWEVDYSEAKDTLEAYHADDRVTDAEFEHAKRHLDEFKWTYDIAERFESLLEDEKFESLFGEHTEYRTYLPSIVLEGQGSGGIERTLQNRQNVREVVEELLQSVVTGETIESGETLLDKAQEQASALVESLLNLKEQTAKRLRAPHRRPH